MSRQLAELVTAKVKITDARDTSLSACWPSRSPNLSRADRVDQNRGFLGRI
jgi:hypothetical protein